MADVRTVRAELDDLDALVPLFDGYRQFYGQKSDPDGAQAFLAERFERGESVIFLAVVDGTAAGFTQLYPSFSSVSMTRVWVLNDLFVDPNGRRAGVVRARGALGLSAAVTNVAAQRLYESCGWIRDDEYFHYHRYV